MTDLRKAADLALQALDIWEDGLTDPCANFGWRFVFIGKEAQEALRQALAQPELQQRTGDCLLTGICAAERHKIYTAPSKCEWVGLTDAEVEAWRGNYDFFDSALVKEVEAKLKEKNSG